MIHPAKHTLLENLIALLGQGRGGRRALPSLGRVFPLTRGAAYQNEPPQDAPPTAPVSRAGALEPYAGTFSKGCHEGSALLEEKKRELARVGHHAPLPSLGHPILYGRR